MKKMIKQLTAVGLICAGMVFSAQAQEKKPESKKTPEEKAEMLTKKMTKELELTSEQQTKVSKVNLESAKEMDALKKELQAIKEKKKALKEKRDTDLKSILTPEQHQKYKELQAERRENMKAHHHSKKGGHKGTMEE